MNLFDQNQWEQQDSEIQDLLNHSEFSSTKRNWLQQNLHISSSRFNNMNNLHCCCCQRLTHTADRFYYCLSQQIATWQHVYDSINQIWRRESDLQAESRFL